MYNTTNNNSAWNLTDKFDPIGSTVLNVFEIYPRIGIKLIKIFKNISKNGEFNLYGMSIN